jgi:hypothetical protein
MSVGIELYWQGYNDGRKEILNDIANILKSNEYPEYVEEELCEYLKNKGVEV